MDATVIRPSFSLFHGALSALSRLVHGGPMRRAAPESLRRDAPESLRRDAPESLRRDAPEPLRRAAPEPLRRDAPGPVRLTRRGRYVVLAFLVAVTALAVVLVARPGNADDPTRPQPATVVHSGDTLWSIAGSYAPHRDRRDTVEDIRRLNHLDGYTLQVGQRLRLPR